MKRLQFAGLLILVAFLAAGAQTTDDSEIYVTVNVEKHVYIISFQDISLGAIDISGTTSASGTTYIRSNQSSWSFSVYAEKGALTEWDATTSTYIADGSTIPYTFRFNSASTIPAERIAVRPMPTTSENAATAVFNRKTQYGSNGEAFTYSIDVVGSSILDEVSAGDYHDVLHFYLTAH